MSAVTEGKQVIRRMADSTVLAYRDMLQAHNALLHVYASHGKVAKAERLFASMQERGPAADSVSAGTLIAAYAKACSACLVNAADQATNCIFSVHLQTVLYAFINAEYCCVCAHNACC